jgi:hypothetical protein
MRTALSAGDPSAARELISPVEKTDRDSTVAVKDDRIMEAAPMDVAG